ncbi:MAG: maleylpyruvate isomerase family mycothiol-dependent enzyme [Candidatus Acidiferrales bacterium]|jgi:uncharacterized protein (TIGR03083 family)
MAFMDPVLEPLPPIFTAHLFPKIEGKLIELLHSLTPRDWDRQTLAPRWKVKDVAAHLLDTQLRNLDASRRDPTTESPSAISGAELLTLIDSLNAEGIRRYGQLSPGELISKLKDAAGEVAEYFQSLDPFAPAMFSVSWAGEEKSLNWFNTARELTERWHHQQQIRLAVDKPGIMTHELYHPVLDCFMRALPYAYRDVTANPGVLARFDISGGCGGSWFLYRHAGAWILNSVPFGKQISRTAIPQEIAWRIFTKGIARDAARAQVQVEGDEEIGLHILKMISIVG